MCPPYLQLVLPPVDTRDESRALTRGLPRSSLSGFLAFCCSLGGPVWGRVGRLSSIALVPSWPSRGRWVARCESALPPPSGLTGRPQRSVLQLALVTPPVNRVVIIARVNRTR